MIIDSHQHLMLPAGLQLQKMEEAGVDKAILFCTTPHPEKAGNLEELKKEMRVLYEVLAGTGGKEAAMKKLADNIRDLAAVLQKYPERFWGFGSVPLGLSVDEASQWIEQYIIRNGLKGTGEFTPGSNEQMNLLRTVLEALTQFPGYPVWVHTFNPVSAEGIKIFMDLCRKFPTVPVIWGHSGGYHWMEVTEFVKETPNAYMDLSAAFSGMMVRIALTEIPDKCFFASDAPYHEPILCRQMIEYVSPSPEVTKLVLGENIMRLIN